MARAQRRGWRPTSRPARAALQDHQEPRPDAEAQRRPARAGRRSRARSGLGDVRAAEHPGPDSHRRTRSRSSSRVDEQNERWLELQVHPERRRPPSRVPGVRSTDGRAGSAVREAPEHDVHHGALRVATPTISVGSAKMLDRMPNVYTETGAMLDELAASRARRATFFVKYQDRILFGKDTLRSQTNTRTTGEPSRPPTSTSTTTATTTRSGSCMVSTCRMSCCASSITETP